MVTGLDNEPSDLARRLPTRSNASSKHHTPLPAMSPSQALKLSATHPLHSATMIFTVSQAGRALARALPILNGGSDEFARLRPR